MSQPDEVDMDEILFRLTNHELQIAYMLRRGAGKTVVSSSSF
jgi:hypothetical protein